ncbi:MAG: hypothetical protein AAGA20_12035 [Planctomycetota bacterium]
MTSPSDDAALVGVVASPLRIEAQLVERTPFGRLRAAGRRLVEDVDGPTRFVPLDVHRQLEGPDADGDEARAAQAWVESIANAIARLTFGVRGGSVRVGLALDARLDGRGRHVMAARDGPRVENIVDALIVALRGRSIRLASTPSRAISLTRALALGEIRSAIGGLAGGVAGLTLAWDREVGWADVARGEVVRESTELPGTRLDQGLVRLDELRRETDELPSPLAASARRGDPAARDLFAKAALALGRAAARRLLVRLSERAPVDSSAPPDRLVLTGTCGRFASDPRLAGSVLEPFEEGLAQGLSDREDAAMRAGLLQAAGSTPSVAAGVLHVSTDDAAAVLGAAASALQGRLPVDTAPRTTPDPSEESP